MIASEFSLPASNSIAKNAKLWAQQCNDDILPGHGIFFDFKGFPEYEKPCLEQLIHTHHWIQEKPFFIRKQKSGHN